MNIIVWFHQWGFVTLKKWDKSKRKYPNRKYKTRAKVFYHPPDEWFDRAYDGSIDKAVDVIKAELISALEKRK